MIIRPASDRSPSATTRSPATSQSKRGRKHQLVDDDAFQRRIEIQHYRDGMALWLSEHTWHHYVTLTDDNRNGPASLLTQGLRFVRRLESNARRRVDYFVIIEGAGRDFPHLHGLLHGTDDLTVKDIRRWWGLGWSCVRRFDPKRGAASYVVKEMAHAEFDTDLWDIRLPKEQGKERRHRRSRSSSPNPLLPREHACS